MPARRLITFVPHVAIEIFCETQEFTVIAQAAAADRRMHRANVKIQTGGTGAAIQAYQTATSPAVVIIEVHGTPSAILDQIDTLAMVCTSGTKVLVVGQVNDVLLYRELMSRGVSDYLISPVEALTLVKAVSDAFNVPGATPLGRTIAVVGSKGGVGASTIAHNLSWVTSKSFGIGTVLVDFDIPFGTVGLDFGQDPPVSISDALAAGDNLDAAVVEGLLIKCRNNDNLNLLTAPATLDFSSDMSEVTVERLAGVLRGVAPLIFLDVPHTWSPWARRLLVSADEIVVVAVPDLANLRNTKNIIETLRLLRPNDTPPKLLLNQVGMPKRPEIQQRDFTRPLETDLLESIPFDVELFYSASNKGQMISEVRSNDKITEKFLKIAAKLAGREENVATQAGLLKSLRSKLRRKKV